MSIVTLFIIVVFCVVTGWYIYTAYCGISKVRMYVYIEASIIFTGLNIALKCFDKHDDFSRYKSKYITGLEIDRLCYDHLILTLL